MFMRVAFASSDGTIVDQHFGMADSFLLWEIDANSAHPVGRVETSPSGEDQESRNKARADALVGCALCYSLQIGGPAAAKLVARHVHPLKTTNEIPVLELVEKLQSVLKGAPPPWLRKTLGLGNAPIREQKHSFEEE